MSSALFPLLLNPFHLDGTNRHLQQIFRKNDITSKNLCGLGQNPLARIAVTADGKRAAAGSVVDGTTVRYQRIAPDALTLIGTTSPALR